jgi:hypothetical protein
VVKEMRKNQTVPRKGIKVSTSACGNKTLSESVMKQLLKHNGEIRYTNI